MLVRQTILDHAWTDIDQTIDFSKPDTSSIYSHLKSLDVKIFKLQILEILENEGFSYTKDIRQLETSLDANERQWIWKLETDTARIKLNPGVLCICYILCCA